MNIKATKDIRNNEELFCYYGDDYQFDSVHVTFPTEQGQHDVQEEQQQIVNAIPAPPINEPVVIDLTADEPNQVGQNLGFVDLTGDDDIVANNNNDNNNPLTNINTQYFKSDGNPLAGRSKLRQVIDNVVLNDKVEVRPSAIPNAGNGLFVKANQTFEKNEIVCTYGGYCYSRQ